MQVLRIVLAQFRALFRRDATLDEIRDELRFHLQMRTEELERQGLDPAAARRAAERRFGNVAVVQDRGYDVRGGGLLETIARTSGTARASSRSTRRSRSSPSSRSPSASACPPRSSA